MAIVAGVWIYSAAVVTVPWVGRYGNQNETEQEEHAILYLITGMFGYDMNLGKCEYMEVKHKTTTRQFSFYPFML